MRIRLVAVSALMCAALTGCTSPGENSREPSPPDSPAEANSVKPASTPHPSESVIPYAIEALPLGATAPLRVYAHCGFQFTEIDGELWKTRLRDDGHGNPPSGWPQVIVGTIERTSTSQAIFVGKNVQVQAVFRPSPNATYGCA